MSSASFTAGLREAARRTPLLTAWRYGTFGIGSRRERSLLRGVETYCLFIGHARSGHSIVGALLDAHPQIVISDELDALRYVPYGFDRWQLTYGSLDIARRQAQTQRQKAGRGGQTYSYHVPGQWQGRAHDLRVVGDSRAGWTTRRLTADPELLDRLRERMSPLRVKFIHVVRNPFDNIATMMVRGGRTFDDAFAQYAANCEAIVPLSKRIGVEALARIRHEDLVGHPQAALVTLCDFLGVTPEPDYLEAASAILFRSPSRSREGVDWPAERLRKVEELVGRFDYLSGYGFDS
jgi:hypothetical protein